MPLKLNKPPNPYDPDYQKLERKINFALHVAIFTATDSGIWFFKSLYHANWLWVTWLTGIWVLLLIGHGWWAFSYKAKI